MDAVYGGQATGARYRVRRLVARVRLDKFRIDLLVEAQWRWQGVGSRLLHHVASQAKATGAATLQARASADDQESLGFLLARASSRRCACTGRCSR